MFSFANEASDDTSDTIVFSTSSDSAETFSDGVVPSTASSTRDSTEARLPVFLVISGDKTILADTSFDSFSKELDEVSVLSSNSVLACSALGAGVC